MDHNWGAGRRSGGLDGGYTGSLDHAIANLHVGRSQGRQQGHREGFEEGRADGYAQGWDAGAACANEKLEPLRAHVREYFAEAVQLRAVVQRQEAMIDLMYEQLAQVAKANGASRAEHGKQAGTSPEFAALKSENDLLKARLEVMDMHYNAALEQSALRQQQYRRSLVVLQSLQGLVEELVVDETPDALRTRQRFLEHYQEQVARGLRDEAIQLAPEYDEVFRKLLPETYAFILRMQASAASPPDVDSPDPLP